MENNTIYTAKDFKSDQYVRWCPGCGDHAVVNTLQKAMAELGIPPHMTAVISGIGCSSRLPYYMNTYGFHTIHGRASAIATGVKVANPELTVWQITGDGDCLAIGGNHFIHAVRRNVDLNIILLNNKIYGLTKGQYSPTSDRGAVTKSSPYGTVEDPFIPAELAFGARGTFFARSIDVDLSVAKEVMVEAARHKGASVVEILQNCVIFNDKIHSFVADKEFRAERTIHLKHGEKMLFGAIIPPRAPISILRLHTVILSSILKDRIVSPANSTKYPVAPPVVILAMTNKAMSLAVTPFFNLPSIVIRIFFGFGCKIHCEAKTISTSLVPIPNATAPNAPCVDV